MLVRYLGSSVSQSFKHYLRVAVFSFWKFTLSAALLFFYALMLLYRQNFWLLTDFTPKSHNAQLQTLLKSLQQPVETMNVHDACPFNFEVPRPKLCFVDCRSFALSKVKDCEMDDTLALHATVNVTPLWMALFRKCLFPFICHLFIFQMSTCAYI